MFGKVQDDSFTHIFDLSLDSEDKFGSSFQQSQNYGIKMSSTSSSPLSSRRDFSSPSSTISTPSSTSSLPLEAAFSQFAASFSSLLADKEAAASAASSLDKKIAELERLKNKINNSDSHSSASSTTSTGSTSTKVNTSRYKTELCRPFSEHGTCKYGEKCQFAHGMAELRTVARHPKYKTDLCRTYHSVGFCPYGPRCHFIHNLEEAKEQERQKANKAIGSGRAPEVGQGINKPLKPLPMFDSQSHPSQQQQQNGSWNPLNSNLFNEQVEQKSRLPVFSTLSK